ncbi:MAG: hypothetical protein NC548_34100 [Lachnospiraceae bacterium]|nr:hypothetical protein [Lachnospiraceae bacterium]
MNNVIIVAHNPFTMESRINIVRNDGIKGRDVSSNLFSLAETIVNLAQSEQIYTVKTSMAEALKEEFIENIKTFELQTYSENKIKVEDI